MTDREWGELRERLIRLRDRLRNRDRRALDTDWQSALDTLADAVNALIQADLLLREVEGERDEAKRLANSSFGKAEQYVCAARLLEGERDRASARAEAAEALLREAVNEYADHQSWRCEHPDRYPLDEVDPPNCPCGLHQFLIRARALLSPEDKGQGG